MSASQPEVTIYTDGGADPNPGPGGWAAILIHSKSGSVKELSGGEPETTNNRMELTAALQALKSLRAACNVKFYTDSEYLRHGIVDQLPGWKLNGWRRKKGGSIPNVDLWQQLSAAIETHAIEWQWVKGHAGNRHNERADELATAEIAKHYSADRLSPVDAEIFLRVSSVGANGGWAALVRHAGADRIISGNARGATANQLDILAAIEALRALPPPSHVRAWSGSDYLRNGATQWLLGWQQQGWKTKDGHPVKNRQAWQDLAGLLAERIVEWPPAKGIVIPEFQRLDTVARAEMQRKSAR